jgi:threonine/homoserine/homoserine lactone efflux protein
MLEEFEQKRRKQVSVVRSMMNYIMGIVFIFFGLYFLIYEQLDINIFNREPSSLDYLIGGLFIIYGLWRIYRGYKKNYFTE